VFGILILLSLGRWIPRIVKIIFKKPSAPYHSVDLYITLWVIFLSLILFVFNDYTYTHKCIFLGLIAYRLFEILQSWISQFVLGGVPEPWNPRNIYRSLVLVFIGYLEIIISYALLALILKNHFEGISSWQEALYYSIRNATTIGSSDVTPISCIGYTVFGTQIMFVLLFLTAVVNSIISYRGRR